MENGAEKPNNNPIEGQINETLSPRNKVIQGLENGLSIFEQIPKSERTKAQDIEITEIKKRLADLGNGGNGTDIIELKDEKDKVIKKQTEGIPVDELLTYLEEKHKEARGNKNKEQTAELQKILHSITQKKYTKDYYDLPWRWVPRYYQARVREEMARMQVDGRATGDEEKDKELATDTLKKRRELFVPPLGKKPIPVPIDPKDQRYTVGIANMDDNAKKMGREVTGEYVRSQLNVSEQVKNKRNPLEWIGKFAHAVRFRWGEQYYKYTKNGEFQAEAIKKGIYFAEIDSATGAFKEVNQAREKQRTEGTAAAERITKGGLSEKEEAEELKNSEFNISAVNLITRFAKGEVTDEQLIQQSEALINTLKNDPNAAVYIREANFLGNNILEVAKVIKSDFERGALKGLANLDQQLSFQVGRIVMAANTEADYSTLEKAMNYLQGGKYRGLLANPLFIGIAFGVAGAGAKSILGWGAKAATAFPLAGAAMGGVFAGLRRWTDIKRDYELNERDTTYSKTSEGKRRKKLNEFSLNIAEGDGKVTALGLSTNLESLANADLKVETAVDALVDQIAEINTRINYGVINKVDLLAYSDRFSVAKERLGLVVKQQEAINKLIAAGLTKQQIDAKLEISTEKFLAKFEKTQKEQAANLNKYRRNQAIFAALVGAGTGLLGGALVQEAWAWGGRELLHQQIGETVIEKLKGGQLPWQPWEWGNATRAAGFAIDKTQELYQHPGNLKISDDLIMRTIRKEDGTMAMDFIDSSNKIIEGTRGHLLPNGHVVFSGYPDKLPNQLRQLLAGPDWQSNPYNNPDFNLQQKVMGLINRNGHEIFAHGNTTVSVDAAKGTVSIFDAPSKNEIFGVLNKDGTFSFDLNDPANRRINLGELESRFKTEAWGMKTEFLPSETLPKPGGNVIDQLLSQPSKLKELGIVETTGASRDAMWHTDYELAKLFGHNTHNELTLNLGQYNGFDGPPGLVKITSEFTKGPISSHLQGVSPRVDKMLGELIDANSGNIKYDKVVGVVEMTNGKRLMFGFNADGIYQLPSELYKFDPATKTLNMVGVKTLSHALISKPDGSLYTPQELLQSGKVPTNSTIHYIAGQPFNSIEPPTPVPSPPTPHEVFKLVPPSAMEFAPPLPQELEPPPIFPTPEALRKSLEANQRPREQEPKTPDTGNPESEQQPITEGDYDLPDIFGKIQGSVPTNHEYYVENPPPEINLTPDQMKELEITLPFFVNFQVEPNGLTRYNTNQKVIPFVFDPVTGQNQRFLNGEKLTDGDSGLLALCGISAETPQQQAALYRAIAQAILKIHENNPDLLVNWLKNQRSPQGQDLNSFAVFATNDLKEGTGQINNANFRPPNERLVIGLPNDTFVTWQQRIAELQRKLESNKLEPYHLRWLEFLAHSVDTRKLIQTLK